MASGQDKLIQALQTALATELGLAQTLRAQIGMAPRGSYRELLERHLEETHNHADWVGTRLEELGVARNRVQVAQGVVKAVAAPTVALAKTPIDIVRGSSAEEKVLKNARDGCAAEALEIAEYRSIETMASDLDDRETRELAQTIRQQEQAALEGLQAEVPRLASNVVQAEVRGRSQFSLSTTGVADAFRQWGESARRLSRRTEARAERAAQQAARQARKVPGVARAEGLSRGAFATGEDLPIANYDELTAQQIYEQLPRLSQRELAMIAAYEGKTNNRRTVVDRIASLQAEEPWPGYDELSVREIEQVVTRADTDLINAIHDYERKHKNRQGVIQATERRGLARTE